tara:strand:- start:1122 stop:1691 length:570 start_codon:yes stop_codon:yes gene_type:complete
MVVPSMITINDRPTRWTNSRCNFNGRRLLKRHKYYENGILYIQLGEKTFKYPPKGGVLIFNHNMEKVLMVRNNYHPYTECQKWGFPKGHVKKDESFTQCAMRECSEETSMKLDITPEHPYILINNSRYYVFVAEKHINATIVPLDTNEINAVEFIDTHRVNTLQMNKEASVILKNKLQFAKEISIKVQL